MINNFVIGVYSLGEKECRTTTLFNAMDISRHMVYAQEIEESNISRIIQEGMRSRSDDSSHQKPKKRFYNQDSSMGNKDKDPNQNSQGGGHSFKRTRWPTCGKQHLGRCLAGPNGCFACGNKIHKMKDYPNIEERGKEVNQASLDPNSLKKNSSHGMSDKKDN